MKKILVIGSRSNQEGETQAMRDMMAYVQRSMDFKNAGSFLVYGCHLDEVGYFLDNDTCEVRDLRNGADFKDYDLVFFRGKLAIDINVASTVAHYLKKFNIPHVNTAHSGRRAVGKVPQMFQLLDLGLPFPKTASASDKYLPSLVKEHFIYPVIVKDVHGSHGNFNFLARDEQHLKTILSDNPDIEFMVQEFIENDGDYRVLFIGSHTAIIHRKGQEGSHLNNTSVGGQATLVPNKDFPQQIIDDSRKFADYCNYEIAGVDAIIDKNSGKHYFLEINSQPQLASGAFVDLKSKLLADYFTQLSA